jgi:hypothetical protein
VKRLCLVGMAMAGLLTASIPAVAAAKPAASGHKKPAKSKPVTKVKSVTTKSSCKLAFTTQPPADDVTVTPGQTGTQYGTVKCGGLLGRGVVSDTFSQDDAGDFIAPFTFWLKGGTLSGKWTLTPTEQVGPPSSSPFTAQTFAGTANISGGSGGWAKSTGKATLKCATSDGAHYACTASVKVTTRVQIKVVKAARASG